MAHQQNYGASLWTTLVILISLIFLNGCSSLIPEQEVKVVTQVQKTIIPTGARPKPVQLTDTRVFVVTRDNYEEFVKEFTEAYGELAFVALSMKDYENLALNIAEIKRFLQQQSEIILYYENAVTDDAKAEPKEKK